MGGRFLGLALLCAAAFGCRKPESSPADASLASAPPPPAASPSLPEPLPSRSADAGPSDDVAARLSAVRQELGPDVPTRLVGGFLILVDVDRGPLFPQAVAAAERAFPLLMNGRFDHAPERAVVAYLFSSEEKYADDCDARFHVPCETPFGQYRSTGRVIEANLARGVTTLVHEMTHPIAQRDFPRARRWVLEGIGALYESPRWDPPGEIHGRTNWRLPEVQGALGSARADRQVRVETLFALDDDAFRRSEDLLFHEALARFFCQWLDERGLLWPFYRAWRDGVSEDPDGRASFAKVVSPDLAKASLEWRAWLRGLAVGR